MALGDGLLGDARAGGEAVARHNLRRRVDVVVHEVDGFLVIGEETGHPVGVGVQILGAGHHGGHHQGAAGFQGVPRLGDVDGGADLPLALGDGGGGRRDGQHGAFNVAGQQLGGDLGGVGEDDLHVRAHFQAAFL